MRQVVFAWLALLTATPAIPAQTWANKLFKDQVTHDFGTVARGAQLYHRFSITNIYAVPLEVTNIRVSCGCITATPNPKVLQPRQTGSIDIVMDARRFSGPKAVSVHVTVGPTYVSTAELKITANSRADVVFNPGHVNFGAVSPGQGSSQVIDVEYAGGLDWRVTEVVAKDLPFDTTLRELYRRPGQVGYQVKVTLRPEAPPGALRHQMYLRTNDPASPLIPVLVEADVQSALSLSPSTLRLGQGQAGDVLIRKVFVQGQKPFRVLGVDGLGDGVSLNVEPSTTPGARQVLVFKIELSKAGALRKELKVRTDSQEGPLPLLIEGDVAGQ